MGRVCFWKDEMLELIILSWGFLWNCVNWTSLCRYELPQPTTGRMNDVTAWQEAVDNTEAQLQHQALRFVICRLSVKMLSWWSRMFAFSLFCSAVLFLVEQKRFFNCRCIACILVRRSFGQFKLSFNTILVPTVDSCCVIPCLILLYTKHV